MAISLLNAGPTTEVLTPNDLTDYATIEYVDNLVNYAAITVSMSMSNAVPSLLDGESYTVREKGQKIESVTLTYNFSKTPAAGTTLLTGYEGVIGKSGNITLDYSASPITWKTSTSGRTWTIEGKEEKVPGKTQAKATKSVSINFYNGVYIGVASIPSEINSEFLLDTDKFTKTLTGSRVTSFTKNAGSGQYIWYALPKSIGKCSFTYGANPGGFLLVTFDSNDYFSFTNASGYSEDYYVYRSDYPALGDTSITVGKA